MTWLVTQFARVQNQASVMLDNAGAHGLTYEHDWSGDIARPVNSLARGRSSQVKAQIDGRNDRCEMGRKTAR